MIRKITCLAVLAFLIGCTQTPVPEEKQPAETRAEVKQHTDIVQELIAIVESDPHFRTGLQNALAYEGRRTDNFWYGKTIDEMYGFFDEWLVFLPMVKTVREFSDDFGAFYTNCPPDDSECGIYIDPALSLVRQDPFRSWIGKFVKARGAFMDSPDSAKNVPDWMKDPDIHMDDYIVPPGGFMSFNQFFTRNLKPGVRPIDGQGDALVLVSPADCDIFPVILDLTADTKINVKGMSLEVSELLGGNPLAKSFEGGKGVLLTLQATYYRHFHSPVDSTIKEAELIDGFYFGAKGFPQGFLAERHRGYFILETEKYGLVGMVPVGIATISSVEFSHSAGETVKKGKELGNFAYGGSAIVLLFQKDRLTLTGKGNVRMGRQIGTLN
jgi:phosphatidylserine decarboxylase